MDLNFSSLPIVLPSPLQHLSSPSFSKNGVNIWVKRDDLIHPDISGNKWRKLKYNLLRAIDEGAKTIITFGGAFSNHLVATASICHELNMRSVGLVRGEIDEKNPTIQFCRSKGMKLLAIPRGQYRDKMSCDNTLQMISAFSHPFVIPEGGTNDDALKGVGEIWEELEKQLDEIDYIFVASGTGGTAAGLLKYCTTAVKVISIPVLKGNFMYDAIMRWNHPEKRDQLICMEGYHFGGYAKSDAVLEQFMDEFQKESSVPLDYVYTGKAMYALMDLIDKNYFPKGVKIVFLHTGGLQGNKGKAYLDEKKK